MKCVFLLFSCSVPLWLPLNPGEVDMVDTVDTAVDTEVTVDTAMVDTVGNDLLMLNPGEVDTVDMEDMVDTAVDTVDMEDMVDTAVDTEDYGGLTDTSGYRGKR